MRRGDALDAIVDDTGGYILGTGPRRDTRGHVIRTADGGHWDCVRAMPRNVLRGLILCGMAGRVRSDRDKRPDWYRGLPTDPDTLAWSIMERGHASGDMTPDQAVEWYVGRVDAVTSVARVTDLVRPEPDPLPEWVDAWVARLVCPVKRAFVADAARSVYWGDEWPTPEPTGREWEPKVWRKLSNRYAAEAAR